MAENPFYKAIDVLHERGWHQGDAMDETTGAVCIYGALLVACGQPATNDGFLPFPVRSLLTDEVGLFVGPWNDEPERTEEDIVLALKKAAVAWDGVGGPEERGSDGR